MTFHLWKGAGNKNQGKIGKPMDVMLCHRGEWGRFPEGWIYEPKLDGTRCIAGKFGDKVSLVSRHKTDYSRIFPEIVSDLLSYPFHSFILDGEIVGKDYLTVAGRTHLQDRFKIELRSKLEPCDYYAFDCLLFQGVKLTHLPLNQRKKILSDIGERNHVKIIKPQPLEELLKQVDSHTIEGIVAKDPSSPYEFRRSHSWIKFRKETVEELLIIGYEDTDKPNRPYRSLILKRGDKEVQASSGLTDADLKLTSQLFESEPKRRVGTKWYFDNPRFTAEVEFFGGSEIPYRFPRIVKLKLENFEKNRVY